MTQHEVVASRRASIAEWQIAYDSAADGHFFLSPEWARVWELAYGNRFEPVCYLLELSSGRSVMVPATRERRAGGLLSITRISAAGAYGGWLAESPLGDAEARAIGRWILATWPAVSWVSNPYDPITSVALQGLDDFTQIIDLRRGFDSAIRGASKANRWAVRRALRAKVQVRRANHRTDWDEYLAMYADTVSRWGKSVGVVYGRQLFDRLAESPSIELWLAVQGSEAVAGAIVARDQRRAYYWHGAARTATLRDQPVNLLIDEVIRWASGEGLQSFDMLASGGHEGVIKFKASFGATRVPVRLFDQPDRRLRLARAARGVIAPLRR